MKPICVPCQRFYRPKKNDFPFIEGMPQSENNEPVPPGTEADEKWVPYKLWNGDLWECRGCSHQIIVGVAQVPFAEHCQYDFTTQVELHNATFKVNDC